MLEIKEEVEKLYVVYEVAMESGSSAEGDLLLEVLGDQIRLLLDKILYDENNL